MSGFELEFAPPRLPPMPPARPVKLGGPGDCRPQAGRKTTSPEMMQAAIILTERKARPHFADDIDALVKSMAARGDVKLAGDVYVSGTPWRAFKQEGRA